MFNVSEMAKLLNTSTTTIYRALNAVQLSSTGILTEKCKGITYFTNEGEKIIRDYLKPVKQNNDECSTVLNDVERVGQPENEELLYLRKQNEILLQELERIREQSLIDLEREKDTVKELYNELNIEREHSRKQSDEIVGLAKDLSLINKNNQVLLKIEQSKNAPSLLMNDNDESDAGQMATTETRDKTPKKNIFNRIFKRKS